MCEKYYLKKSALLKTQEKGRRNLGRLMNPSRHTAVRGGLCQYNEVGRKRSLEIFVKAFQLSGRCDFFRLLFSRTGTRAVRENN